MDRGSELWQRLASRRTRGMGALQLRQVGLGRLVWLDVDRLRELGLGAVSLWPLVQRSRVRRLALVSGRARRAALLVSGAGIVLRFWRGNRIRLRLRQRRLGGAGAL